jgi:apolipoprotein N-acyltransferase
MTGWLARVAAWFEPRRVAAATAALAGWRRAGAALLLGAAATLALPPWYIAPLLLVGFTGLMWLLDGVGAAPWSVRRAALTGFCFGFGYFAVGIHWIAEAFLVDPVRHGWMIPFALGGLSALLGLFPAAACALFVWLRRRFAVAGARRVLLFAACWIAFEWLRGWVLTGFPWALVGYAWSFSPAMMQSAAFAGALGLSLATLAVAAMPAVLGDARRSHAALLVAAALLPAMLAGGWLRLAGAPDYVAAPPGETPNPALVPGIRLRVVQAGIPQRLKWRSALRRDHLLRHIALSRAAAGPLPTHVVWPETAVPYALVDDATAREQATLAVPPGGLLLTGTIRYDELPGGNRRFFNAAVALAGDGSIRAVYDKVHLVPFGEYVPLGRWLPLDKIVVGAGDFAAGPALRTLDLPGLPPVGPLICYEAIFPGAVTAAGRRPEWLLNLTNDGWFGVGAGPRQHLAIATMRAVEEGLPLVRAAGTGISAIVDPYGRELGRLGIGAVGALDGVLPRSLRPPPFAILGDAVPASLTLAVLLWALTWRRGRPDNDI